MFTFHKANQIGSFGSHIVLLAAPGVILDRKVRNKTSEHGQMWCPKTPPKPKQTTTAKNI